MSPAPQPRMHGLTHVRGGPDPIPQDELPVGLIAGCAPVEFAYRIQGALTAWWRCGDSFTFGSSVADALLDTSNWDPANPLHLEYEEDWADDRPTLEIADPDLGTGDDGAIQLNSTDTTGGSGQRFFRDTGVNLSALTFWGTTANLIQTMVCRIKPNNTNGASPQPYVGRWGMDNSLSVNWGWVLDVVSLTLNFKNFNATTNTTLSTPGALTADQWYSIAVRWDGSLWELLVDGVVVDSETNANAPGISTSDFGFSLGYGNYDFGVSDRDRWGNGGLDEVALYNRPLTDAELLLIAQSHGSGTTPYFCEGTIDSTENVGDTFGVHSTEPDDTPETSGHVLTADGAGGSSWEAPASGGLDSIAVTGESELIGDVTLSEGTNVTLTQSGNDIEISAAGGGGGGWPAPIPLIRVGSTENRWYPAGQGGGTALTTETLTANRLKVLPFVTSRDITLDRIAAEITSAVGGSNIRLGIYDDDGNVYPDALLIDSGNLSSASVAVVTATISQALTAGVLYWFGCVGSSTPILRGIPSAALLPILGNASTLGNAPGFGWDASHTFGALPDPYPAGASAITGTTAAVFVRAS